jgi:sulfite dehydrogenase
VRYHINPPSEVDLSTWRLKVGGHVEQPLELSTGDLRNEFPQVTVVAVNQCSGNGRGYFAPRVFGGQWANGAMGNAEWTGVRLRDVLAMCRVKEGAVDVTFNGLDRPAVPTVPDFVKSLRVSRIMADPNVWVKNLSDITVLDHNFDGFWMTKAYLIPDTPCGCVEPGSTPAHTVPINRMDVRSFIASPENGARVGVGRATMLKGIAFDGGYGIQDVTVSTDTGATWRPAQLGRDLGPYSFREWSFNWTPRRSGMYRLMVRATNKTGESQPSEPLWNPPGYLRNVVEQIELTAA